MRKLLLEFDGSKLKDFSAHNNFPLYKQSSSDFNERVELFSYCIIHADATTNELGGEFFLWV
jgi:hypothetical protein